MAKAEDITPIRKQYLAIKRQYPNAILFFRLGDFYETFDQDAEIAARELDIVLTSRPVGKGVRVPLAGIPHHAVENYLARLIERGYHVAICEQVGDQPSKGIFPREVVRVITPGTLIESGLLPSDANNYLVCVQIQENHAGVAYVDISTGEFATTELASDDILIALRAELSRLHPAEILYPENIQLPDGLSGHLTPWQAWHFDTSRCQDAMKKHFGVSSLDGFGLRGMTLAMQAAGTIVQYLMDTQPTALKLLSSLNTYSTSEFMNLDASTRRNLELTETIRDGDIHGSLLGELDRAITPMGKRLIRQWVSKPLLDVGLIVQRQQCVQFLFNQGMFRTELRAALRPLNDLERLTTRVASGTAQPRDLVGMRATLQRLPGISNMLSDHRVKSDDSGQATIEPALSPILNDFDTCEPELNLLEAAIADDPPATLQNIGVIKSGFSAELDGVIERSRHAREWIANLESVERERTGIKTLKVGYNKIFGYYIEVTRANSELVPLEYIRKQTLVNAERYITPEMKEYEALVLNAEDSIHEIEKRIFLQVCEQLSSSSQRLLETSRALAELDVVASLAEVAALGGYVLPAVVTEDILEIHEGRHPVVEHALKGERFITNDAIFEEGERIRILTGPNMSGKSTFLRQTALIVLMAQMGSFVPAASAKIGLVDRIFTRIGAQDEIYSGQSTFMVEMVETANILHHATNRSLLILDEIGRGTSTYDGVAIAWAVVEYIHNHPSLRSKTLFATHYHELTQLADLLPGVRNYNVAVSETGGQVVFLHMIIPGGADRSYGIHVGQLAGLPLPVVQRAEQIMLQLEKSSGKAVKINPDIPHQMALFPDTNPLLDDLKSLDINTLSPIEALNKLYEWKKKFLDNV
jgi:DNA mismatch repair protein MutS